MRKVVFLFFAAVFLFVSCSHFEKKPLFVIWPDSLEHLEAFCEIDIAMKDRQYSGEMSLKVEYPDSLYIEIYGPFGNTILSVARSQESFAMRMNNEVIDDEDVFYRLFHIKIDDIIDDLMLRDNLISKDDGTLYKERDDYRVFYLNGHEGSSICWKGPQGDFCIRFLEVNFSKGV